TNVTNGVCCNEFYSLTTTSHEVLIYIGNMLIIYKKLTKTNGLKGTGSQQAHDYNE
ncbi:hypothetical protein WUBG_10638, partial [Wuchereria bancrofti]